MYTLDIQSYPRQVWCLIGMFWGSIQTFKPQVWLDKGTANNQALRIQVSFPKIRRIDSSTQCYPQVIELFRGNPGFLGHTNGSAKGRFWSVTSTPLAPRKTSSHVASLHLRLEVPVHLLFVHRVAPVFFRQEMVQQPGKTCRKKRDWLKWNKNITTKQNLRSCLRCWEIYSPWWFFMVIYRGRIH